VIARHENGGRRRVHSLTQWLRGAGDTRRQRRLDLYRASGIRFHVQQESIPGEPLRQKGETL